MKLKIQIALILLLFISCGNPDVEYDAPSKLFTLLSAETTQIDFANNLDYNEDFNIYTYRNFYNGGGVGLGDFNNDGFLDIYFTANMTSNRLYMNKGEAADPMTGFQFEDITASAKVGGGKGWSTGVSIADINGDGWMDIYVCNSGELEGDNKQNELFINNGISTETGQVTFSEKAEAYGLADQGFSTHAAFFDYDKDGDLDVYLLNNSFQAIGSFNLKKNMRPVRDPVGGDKLFRNDGDQFTDVSESAGIYGSVIGFGLGVTVGDIDQDGWQDIYVSNDFFEKDYIYINNGDGTFREELEDQMRSISGASMGADMADINNDGYSDIFVTEMLPGKNERLKTKTTFENWDKYQYNIQNGYYHQFTRNMLHLNNNDGTFSEIGRLAGVEATDWSWGALIMDMDNDGFKDIFVANGIFQDLTDQDYINFISNEETLKSMVNGKKVDYKSLIDSIPSEQIPNYAFHNLGQDTKGITFEDKAKDWGLDTPGHSNGSAYGDLDNDGDLDLVVNNVNQKAFVYKNETTEQLKNHRYLKVILKGEGKNSFAVGTKLKVIHQGQQFFLEQMPVRGFESTIDHRPNFGLGNIEMADSLVVIWPDDKVSILTNVVTNQSLILEQKDALVISPDSEKNMSKSIFQDVTDETNLDFRHQENDFIDFDTDRLLYHMLSTEGPKMDKGDVNGDGLEDFFIGGARDASGKLFIQNRDGQFTTTNTSLFEEDKTSEDTGVLFFDSDGDGDLDLYVASGGNEFSSSSAPLKDRLYFNDGNGQFTKSDQLLPAGKYESSSTVKAADYDQDGDLDLFVGIRLRPRLYGVPASSYILQNNGQGNFRNVSHSAAPGLKEVGMVTDAVWTDIDGDKDMDLMVVGDWMPVTIFKNENGTFSKSSIPNSSGWWNTIHSGDFDNDGDLDYVLGNHGLNSRFCATPDEPITMHINDFDQNGTVEQIVSCYENGVSYPLVLRHDLVMQIPSLKKKYLKYTNYKNQTIHDIFTPEQLQNALVDTLTHLESSILINDANGKFSLSPLPLEAQLAPVYGILVEDFDGDGNADIILGGNLYQAKPEVGRYDASYGTYLKGDGTGHFTTLPASASGYRIEGQARDIIRLKNVNKNLILVARNNDKIQIFQKE